MGQIIDPSKTFLCDKLHYQGMTNWWTYLIYPSCLRRQWTLWSSHGQPSSIILPASRGAYAFSNALSAGRGRCRIFMLGKGDRVTATVWQNILMKYGIPTFSRVCLKFLITFRPIRFLSWVHVHVLRRTLHPYLLVHKQDNGECRSELTRLSHTQVRALVKPVITFTDNCQ